MVMKFVKAIYIARMKYRDRNGIICISLRRKITSQTRWRSPQLYDSARDRIRAAVSAERGLIVHLNGAGPLEHEVCQKKTKKKTRRATGKTY